MGRQRGLLLHERHAAWLLLLALCSATRAWGHPGTTKLLGSFNCDSVGFFKTHKTGSSTVALILDRVGAMLGKRFLLPTHVLHNQPGVKNRISLRDSPGPADFSTLHVAGSFLSIARHWRRVLQAPGLLTIVREPLSRYISHFFYFNGHHLTRQQLLDGKETERLLRDYNITMHHGTQSNEILGTRLRQIQRLNLTDQFLRSGLFDRTVFLTLENLSEGVAALHLHCGWPLRYLTYGKIHCAECWDSKLASVSPKGQLIAAAAKRALSDSTRQHIEAKLAPDAALHEAALRSWEPVRKRGGQGLQAIARELERRNTILDHYCKHNVKKPGDFVAFPGCLWISLHPLEFIELVGHDGRMDGNKAFRPSREHNGFPSGKILAKQIMADYNTMYDRLFGLPARHVSVQKED